MPLRQRTTGVPLRTQKQALCLAGLHGQPPQLPLRMRDADAPGASGHPSLAASGADTPANRARARPPPFFAGLGSSVPDAGCGSSSACCKQVHTAALPCGPGQTHPGQTPATGLAPDEHQVQQRRLHAGLSCTYPSYTRASDLAPDALRRSNRSTLSAWSAATGAIPLQPTIR